MSRTISERASDAFDRAVDEHPWVALVAIILMALLFSFDGFAE